ncbi:MAG: helix-turn-helix domain-containing protein [Sphingopyxis sp.]
MAHPPIPTAPLFALYGEPGGNDAPAFVHIETIRARSARHSWEIQPHRHAGFYQLLLLNHGRADVHMDGLFQTIAAPALMVAPPQVVHGFRFVPDSEGAVLTLSADFAHRAARPDDPLWRALGRAHIVPLPAGMADQLGRITREMLAVQADGMTADPALSLCLAEVWARMAARAVQPQPSLPGADARIADFRSLVEQHFRTHRPVADYAAMLGVTPRHLTRLTRQALQCAPKEWLDRRMAIEAQRLLLYSNASCAQIAEELGFVDPSYFSRFYVRMTGQRPSVGRGGGVPRR